MIFLLAGYSGSFAKPITVKDAKQIAEAKLLQHSKYDYSINHNETVTDDKGNVLFYAVHLNPVGFVIVPGDDEMIPVIAYSFMDNIDAGGKFFDFLINDIQKRYDALDKIPVSMIKSRQQQRQDLINLNFEKDKFEQWPPRGTTATGGWLESNWTQDAPYNQMCPIDPVTSTRSYAGCPAVAMAMILNYHQTVNSTVFTDDDDYYHSYAGRNYYIDDDYEENEFPCFPDLNKYLDTLVMHYENIEPLTNNDKAALTFACGVAATQVYTSEGSGTFGVSQAFEAYLKFACEDIQLLDEDDVGIYDSLTQNMKDSLPAHLAVVNESWTSGHNVVVDGYNTDGYYHVNFGWGGSYNAWYILPDEFPYSLTVIEGLIIDIMKPEAPPPAYINSKLEHSVNLYPNPAENYFSIFTENINPESVCIYNLQGTLIKEINEDQIYNVSTDNIPGGTYIIKIKYTSGQVLNKKLIVIK